MVNRVLKIGIISKWAGHVSSLSQTDLFLYDHTPFDLQIHKYFKSTFWYNLSILLSVVFVYIWSRNKQDAFILDTFLTNLQNWSLDIMSTEYHPFYMVTNNFIIEEIKETKNSKEVIHRCDIIKLVWKKQMKKKDVIDHIWIEIESTKNTYAPLLFIHCRCCTICWTIVFQ